MRKKEELDVRRVFNEMLELAIRSSREGFSPDVLQQYARDAERAREERQREQMREATPVRQAATLQRAELPRGERRGERREATPTLLQRVGPEVSEEEVRKSVDLASRVEFAARPENTDRQILAKLHFRRDWGRETA
jgi:hypothetical protein